MQIEEDGQGKLPESWQLWGRFSEGGVLDWDGEFASAGEIAERYGERAAVRSLRMLERAALVSQR